MGHLRLEENREKPQCQQILSRTWEKILELSQKAERLYERQEMEEKRRLLNFVFSNSTWKHGKLNPTYKQPFDILAVINTEYQTKKASIGKNADLRPIMLPFVDAYRTFLMANQPNILSNLQIFF